MLLIHAAQKLMNVSGIKPVLYVTEPSEGQLMHSWYARLLATGFVGKTIIMYCHFPTMLTIVCKGRSIKSTFPEFRTRLRKFLQRNHFESSFIEKEMLLTEEYIVGKTDSRSQLGYMNALVVSLEIHCHRSVSFESIDQDYLEDVSFETPYYGHKPGLRIFMPSSLWAEHTKG